MIAGIVEKKLITPTTPVARRSKELPLSPISWKIWGAYCEDRGVSFASFPGKIQEHNNVSEP
jgi:hypothetical protein